MADDLPPGDELPDEPNPDLAPPPKPVPRERSREARENYDAQHHHKPGFPKWLLATLVIGAGLVVIGGVCGLLSLVLMGQATQDSRNEAGRPSAAVTSGR